MKALEKDRTRRYQTANALAADVRRHLHNEPVSAGPPSAAYRAGKFVRRHRFGVAAAATLVLLLAAFAVAMAVQARRTARERDKAERLATFMVELFKVSDPSEARGNTITAREVLDKGAERISRELKDEPETKATLLAAMGNAYVSLGLYGPATPLLEEALRLRRRIPGIDHGLLANSIMDLERLNMDKGEYAAAEPLAREALVFSRRHFGSSSAEVARALYLLGSLHFFRGDLASAEPLWEEHLTIQKDLRGPEHPDVARGLNSLAALLHTKGDYARAAALYEESLALKRKSLGSDHPQVATTLANLAAVRHEKGEYDAAEPLYREVLAMERRLFGGEHPEVARDMGNLAELLSDRGDLTGAESLQREALQMSRRLLGDVHPIVAWARTNLARVLARQGRADEAEPLAREALDTWYKTGVDHDDPGLGRGRRSTRLLPRPARAPPGGGAAAVERSRDPECEGPAAPDDRAGGRRHRRPVRGLGQAREGPAVAGEDGGSGSAGSPVKELTVPGASRTRVANSGRPRSRAPGPAPQGVLRATWTSWSRRS